MEEYPFSTRHNGYLLFVGRISQEKGVHFAIEAANTLHMPLIIAAKLDAVDVPYFKEKIEPLLSDNIQWIGEVNEQKRNELMSKAQCVLHPTNWHEPFGLTLIEAMACGAPVVAYNKGSIPEIIKDGYTGYVVEDLPGMIQAIMKSDRIRRIDCHKHALTHFNARRMATKYVKIYKSILKPRLEVSRDERFSYLH
jgi:glycosyltransferase involved in cell wall biosynthesis